MKVLVATNETQGNRASDFTFVPPGELVHFSWECDRDRDDIDFGGCGCRRSFSGVECRKATTTATVEDRGITMNDLAAKLVGYNAEIRHASNTEASHYARQDAIELLRIAEAFPVGAILEKRGDKICQRGGDLFWTLTTVPARPSL